MKCAKIIALLCALLAIQEAACDLSEAAQICECKPGGIANRTVIPANGNINLAASEPAACGPLFNVPAKLYTLSYVPSPTPTTSAPVAVTFSLGVTTAAGGKCAVIVQTGCGCSGNATVLTGSYLNVEINPSGTQSVIRSFPSLASTVTSPYPPFGQPPEYWAAVSDWLNREGAAPPADNAGIQLWPPNTWDSPTPDCSIIDVNIFLAGNCTPAGISHETDIISDPHIVSWERVAQTVFHEGDFVLAESRASGLAVHGRLCKSARGPWAPWTCAIAVRCDHDSNAIEVSAAAWEKVASSGAALVTDSASGIRTIRCASGLNVQMMRHRFHRFWYLNARLSLDPRRQSILADLRGLLGSPNGNRHDGVVGRDGSSAAPVADEHLIGHTSAAVDDVHESWRVPSDERLFSSSFVPLGGVLPASKRRHIPSSLTAAAQAACDAAGVTNPLHAAACAHDTVMLRQRKNAFAKDLVEFVRALADEAVFPLHIDFSPLVSEK